MTALTAARDTWSEETVNTLRIPMADSATIYQGGLVNVDANGYAVAAADTVNHKFAGVAIEDPQNPARSVYNNSAGGNGDMHVVVRQVGRFRFQLYLRTPAQNMLFAMVYVHDDSSVSVHKFDETNDIRCGHIVRLPADTIALDPQADFASDEVEIQASGEPFEWTGDFTTTTTTPAQ